MVFLPKFLSGDFSAAPALEYSPFGSNGSSSFRDFENCEHPDQENAVRIPATSVLLHRVPHVLTIDLPFHLPLQTRPSHVLLRWDVSFCQFILRRVLSAGVRDS